MRWPPAVRTGATKRGPLTTRQRAWLDSISFNTAPRTAFLVGSVRATHQDVAGGLLDYLLTSSWSLSDVPWCAMKGLKGEKSLPRQWVGEDQAVSRLKCPMCPLHTTFRRTAQHRHPVLIPHLGELQLAFLRSETRAAAAGSWSTRARMALKVGHMGQAGCLFFLWCAERNASARR